ncbi:MAG: peptidylprolyl isomerase [Alphaproteobacteria bacterium]|nr:peptidylprolyl isomerase [Alphaproteobacteria bacterium]
MQSATAQSALPRGAGVRVNGTAIPRDLIAREVQHHPARTPIEAWKAAARALAVRELLVQEARRLGVVGEPAEDDEGRRETAEEAAVRELVEREVRVPTADENTCRRYYEQNRGRFRSGDIYEAAHILFAASRDDAQAYAKARDEAAAVLAELRDRPECFAEYAESRSDCPSANQGGNLGQIGPGQTTPEFERALFALDPGTIALEPVATRYGFHIVRLDRRIEGRELPFELVAARIAEYLNESVRRRATAQYIARLAGAARIEGVEFATPEVLRVN